MSEIGSGEYEYEWLCLATWGICAVAGGEALCVGVSFLTRRVGAMHLLSRFQSLES